MCSWRDRELDPHLNCVEHPWDSVFPPLPGPAEGDRGEGPGGDSEEGGLEPASYWKRKEALLRSSTVSLGVGEKFFSGNCSQTQSAEVYIRLYLLLLRKLWMLG